MSNNQFTRKQQDQHSSPSQNKNSQQKKAPQDHSKRNLSGENLREGKQAKTTERRSQDSQHYGHYDPQSGNRTSR